MNMRTVIPYAASGALLATTIVFGGMVLVQPHPTTAGCATSYHEAVSLLKQQTAVLTGVATAANEAMTASLNTDPAGAQQAVDDLHVYTAQFDAIAPKIDAVNEGACG